MKYKENWQLELSLDSWNTFLEYTKSDDHCNHLWNQYRNKNISYEEVSRYEYQLYILLKRENNLNILLDNQN